MKKDTLLLFITMLLAVSIYSCKKITTDNPAGLAIVGTWIIDRSTQTQNGSTVIIELNADAKRYTQYNSDGTGVTSSRDTITAYPSYTITYFKYVVANNILTRSGNTTFLTDTVKQLTANSLVLSEDNSYSMQLPNGTTKIISRFVTRYYSH